MKRDKSIGVIVLLIAFSLASGTESWGKNPWRIVKIQMDEYRFIPKRILLNEGTPVTIELRNIGNEEHEFRSRFFDGPLIEVEGNGVSVKSIEIHSIIVQPGTTASIKWISPKAGAFVFECRIPSHHGMDGTIIVDQEK